MSTVRQPPADLQQTLAALYATVGSELRRVDTRLADELQSDHAQANEVIRHGIRLSGKRLRPALLLLAGQAVGPLRDEHITLAAVVEMIHTATLVHDDVLDEAAIRRHEDTVNARWNNETSVLLGDFLFTHAFYLASTLESTYACRTIGRATNIVCDGELRQTITSGDVNLSEDDYLAIVEAKTAELCACCLRAGRLLRRRRRGDRRPPRLLRPQPRHRLPDRRRPAGPRRQRIGHRQIARHRPGQAQDDAPADPRPRSPRTARAQAVPRRAGRRPRHGPRCSHEPVSPATTRSISPAPRPSSTPTAPRPSSPPWPKAPPKTPWPRSPTSPSPAGASRPKCVDQFLSNKCRFYGLVRFFPTCRFVSYTSDGGNIRPYLFAKTHPQPRNSSLPRYRSSSARPTRHAPHPTTCQPEQHGTGRLPLFAIHPH